MPKLSPTARTLTGALVTYLAPRLAQDAILPDIPSLLADVTRKNFSERIPTIERRVNKAMRGRMAMDADIEDLAELLDAFEDGEHMPNEDEEEDIASRAHENDVVEGDEHPLLMRIKDRLKDDLTPEALAKLDEMLGEEQHLEEDTKWNERAMDARRRLGRDETEEERERREEREGAMDARKRLGRDETEEEREKRAEDARMSRDRRTARDKKRAMDARKRLGRDESEEELEKRREKEHAEDRKRAMDARKRMGRDAPPAFRGQPETGGTMEPITKEALDSAIKVALDGAKKMGQAVREAERFVRPYVGDLNMAFDSDEQVYRKALDILGVAHKGVHSSALRTIIEMRPKPGAQTAAASPRVATDAKGSASFDEMFPGASRIGHA